MMGRVDSAAYVGFPDYNDEQNVVFDFGSDNDCNAPIMKGLMSGRTARTLIITVLTTTWLRAVM